MPGPAYRDWLRAVGAPEDPVATDTSSSWSLISLLKAIFQAIADGSFAAGIVGRAESLVGLAQGGATQAMHYMKLARASRVAAASSASSASTSETNASNSAAVAETFATLGYFTAGNAMLGQRAKRDRVAAAASATAAAASAAAITSEGLVLGVQVYS